jgi:hypothetical protein
MMTILVLAVSLTACALAAILLPLRVRVTAKGRGTYGDTWVLAAGVECWPVTLSVAAAHAAERVLQLHVGSRPILRRTSLQPAQPAKPEASTTQRLQFLRAWIQRHFDLGDLIDFTVRLTRYVRLKCCRGRLIYSTPDVSVTGMLSGLLYVVTGLLSPLGQFEITPEWDSVARAEGDFDLVVRFWPVQIAVATVLFVIRNVRLRPHVARLPAPAQS